MKNIHKVKWKISIEINDYTFKKLMKTNFKWK